MDPPAITLATADVIELSERAAAQYEADRLVVTPTADFVATGWYAPAGAQFTVQVDGAMDRSHPAPRLMVGTYSRYAGRGDPQEFPLAAGNNKLTAGPYGGLVFLRHTAPAPPFGLNKLKFSFVNGLVRAPRYVLDKRPRPIGRPN